MIGSATDPARQTEARLDVASTVAVVTPYEESSKERGQVRTCPSSVRHEICARETR